MIDKINPGHACEAPPRKFKAKEVAINEATLIEYHKIANDA